MALFSGSRGFVLGFATGFGAGLVARDAAPQIKAAAAPILRFALRTGMEAAEKSREVTARFAEFVQDTLAEVQSEMKERRFAAQPRAQRKAKRARARKERAKEAPLQRRGENVVELNAARGSS